jgi:chaperonin cofactor prefoldin
MVDLENDLKTLEKRVQTLKRKNAILQKEYFELKELEGE